MSAAVLLRGLVRCESVAVHQMHQPRYAVWSTPQLSLVEVVAIAPTNNSEYRPPSAESHSLRADASRLHLCPTLEPFMRPLRMLAQHFVFAGNKTMHDRADLGIGGVRTIAKSK